MHQVVQNKRFHSELDRLKSRLLVCQRLAVAMQADWRGILRQDGKEWIFDSGCIDCPESKKLPPISLGAMSISYEDKKFSGFVMDFYSTGQVSPEGTLAFYLDPKDPKKKQEKWRLPDIFRWEVAGQDVKAGGPVHPDD